MLKSTLSSAFIALLLLSSAVQSVEDHCAKGPYRYLALEGGGVRGIAYAGMLSALDHSGVLSDLRGFAGTSAGSIGAALLASGYTASEVAAELTDRDFNEFLQSSGFRLTDFSRLLSLFGWYDNARLGRIVDDLIRKRSGLRQTTFAALYALTNKELRVTAVCMNTGELTYFDRVSHPHMPVSTAVQASAAIPFFFRPVLFEQKLYVDGGVMSSLPMKAFKNQEGSTLGVSLMRSGRLSSVKSVDSFGSLPEYAMQFIRILLGSATRTVGDYRPEDSEMDMISLDVDAVDAVDFNVCDAQKDWMISVGYNGVADHLVQCGHAVEHTFNRPDIEQVSPCSSSSVGQLQESEDHFWDQLLSGLTTADAAPPSTLTFVLLICVGVLICAGLLQWWINHQWWISFRQPRSAQLLPDILLLTDRECIDLSAQLTRELGKRLSGQRLTKKKSRSQGWSIAGWQELVILLLVAVIVGLLVSAADLIGTC